VALTVSGYGAPTSAVARRGFAWLGAAWAIALGVSGALLVFLWAFTDHVVAYHNENLFQANLLLLPLALLAPRVAGGVRWAVRPAVALGVVVATASLVGLALKLVPTFYQANAEVLALAVPANLGLALGLRGLTRRLR